MFGINTLAYNGVALVMKEKRFLALSPRGWGAVLINCLSPVINTVQQ